MHVYNNNINSNNNNDSAVNIPLGGSSCPLFQVKLDWGRETGGPGEKNPLSKEENQQQTQTTCDARSCIEPAPQCWETNVLAICLPPLLSPLGYPFSL